MNGGNGASEISLVCSTERNLTENAADTGSTKTSLEEHVFS